MSRFQAETGHDAHIKDKSEFAENRQKRIGRRCTPRSCAEGNTRVGRVNLVEQVLQVLFSGNQHCPNLLSWIIDYRPVTRELPIAIALILGIQPLGMKMQLDIVPLAKRSFYYLLSLVGNNLQLRKAILQAAIAPGSKTRRIVRPRGGGRRETSVGWTLRRLPDWP